MIDQGSHTKKIDHILQGLYGLLSFQEKDAKKVQILLSVLDQSVALKKSIKLAQIRAEQNDQQIVKQSLEASLAQKQRFINSQKQAKQNLQEISQFKQDILQSLSTFFISIYQMKQLQSLLSINQRKLKVNQQLEEKSQEVKIQYESYQKQISKSYQQNKSEDQTFKSITNDLQNQVDFKKAQKKNLQTVIQRYTIRQQHQREKYIKILELQNKNLIQLVKSPQNADVKDTKDKQTKNKSRINIQKSAIDTSNIEIRPKKLKQGYTIEKISGIILALSTLFLFIYFLTSHS